MVMHGNNPGLVRRDVTVLNDAGGAPISRQVFAIKDGGWVSMQ